MRTGARWLGAVLLAGCASLAPSPAPTSLERNAALEFSTRPLTDTAPTDGPLPLEITLRSGAQERVLPGAYFGALPWDGALATLRADGTLLRVALDGDDLVLATDVASLPVTSLDLAHLAYASSSDGVTGTLHVLDALGDRVLARDLASIGALTFSPDGGRIAFVGSARSGIAGVWWADARGGSARCLTNCGLQPGDDLSTAVPLPAAGLRFEDQALHWDDEAGVAHSVRP